MKAIRWQMINPVPFFDLTDEVKKCICNGCGGKDSWFKPAHALLFKSACNPHDYDYSIGGNHLDKFKADNKLRSKIRVLVKYISIRVLRDNLLMDDSLLPDFVIRQIYYRWADLYYIGVMAGGLKFFRYGKKRWPLLP